MLACRLHNILVRLKNNSLNGFVFLFLGMRKKRTAFYGDPFFLIPLRGEDPTPLLSLPQPMRLLSDRSEKSTPYAHFVPLPLTCSVFVCLSLTVDNSANNSLTSKYCVVALFSLTHKKH